MTVESQENERREPVDESGEDKGPRVHTSAEEGHPAGEGERSDRDIGGPTTGEEDDDAATGGAAGTPDETPFESH